MPDNEEENEEEPAADEPEELADAEVERFTAEMAAKGSARAAAVDCWRLAQDVSGTMGLLLRDCCAGQDATRRAL